MWVCGSPALLVAPALAVAISIKISFHAKFQLFNLSLLEIIRYYILLILVLFNPYM